MIKIHTRTVDYAVLSQLSENNESIRHTPHIGGELTGYHQALLGGIASHVVLVDTASATNDVLGGVGRVDGQGFVNGRWSQSPAAALTELELNAKKAAQLEAVLKGLGIESERFLEATGKTFVANLVKTHEHILDLTSSAETTVLSAANYWREQGDAADAMSRFMAEEGLFRRRFDLKSKQFKNVEADQVAARERNGLYYEGENASGLIPTVESLLALWVVQAAIEGRDVTYEFLNPESVDYITKGGDFEERVKKIAKGTLALMGITTDTTYCYLVAKDYSAMDELGGSLNQFDRLRI